MDLGRILKCWMEEKLSVYPGRFSTFSLLSQFQSDRHAGECVRASERLSVTEKTRRLYLACWAMLPRIQGYKSRGPK